MEKSGEKIENDTDGILCSCPQKPDNNDAIYKMKKISICILTGILSFTLNGCGDQEKFPTTLMKMNNPEYLLKDSLFWNINESEHFIYYSSKKVEHALINDIIENQESNLIHIAKIMGIKDIDTLPKIRFWIFDSDNEKYIKTQVRSNAHTLTEYWSTYYNKNNATGAHETGHLMSQHFWGYLNSREYDFLMQEGFAFYVDETRFFKFDLYKKAKNILQNEKFKVSALISVNSNDDYESRAIVCGAFVKYLIVTFGVEKFSYLWKNVEKENIYHTIYKKSFTDLENDFYSFIETKN